MNPEQQINTLKQALQEFMNLIGNDESEESQDMIAQVMEHIAGRIQQLRQEEQQPEQPPQQEPFQGNPQQAPQNQGLGEPPSPDAQLLWILAGQQEDAFLEYLQQYHTPETLALLQNPAELERVIQFLHQMMPSGRQPVIDGIQHSDLNSSNIWGTQYNPSNQKMRVRFQGGAEYEYDNIPTNIYRAFSQGQASAKTDGQNDYGKWWKGKNPSMGAAMNQYIKQGGFPYRRVA